MTDEKLKVDILSRIAERVEERLGGEVVVRKHGLLIRVRRVVKGQATAYARLIPYAEIARVRGVLFMVNAILEEAEIEIANFEIDETIVRVPTAKPPEK